MTTIGSYDRPYAALGDAALQKILAKRAAAFELEDARWNSETKIALSLKIMNHIVAPTTVRIIGRYRQQDGFVHNLDPWTRLSVLQQANGVVLSGWVVGRIQLINLVRRGSL